MKDVPSELDDECDENYYSALLKRPNDSHDTSDSSDHAEVEHEIR